MPPPIIKPPFTLETAKAKVQAAEDAWNSRDPERVAGDVRAGLVSVDEAQRSYGVAVDAAGVVDVAATAALRSAGR